MAKVIVTANNKGGCGKTTTALNVGAGLRLRGFDVLLIDIDGQANLTASVGAAPEGVPTSYEALNKPAAPVDPLRVLGPGAGFGVLDLLPASPDLAAVEVEQAGAPDRITRLSSIVEALRGRYDFILIDTPPAMGLLTISALYAADNAIVTVQPQYLAVQGLLRLYNTIHALNGSRAEALSARVLFTQYDRRKGLHRLSAEQVGAAGFPTYRTKIRDNVALGEAPAAGLDVFRYDRKSKGAEDYTALCAEIITEAKVRHRAHGYK